MVSPFAGAGLVLVAGQGLRGGDGRGQVGQQCVPAVGGGLGVDGVLVEVPVQGRPSVGVGADGRAQVVTDAPLAGDGVDPGGDRLGGRVVARAQPAAESGEVVAGAVELVDPAVAAAAARAEEWTNTRRRVNEGSF